MGHSKCLGGGHESSVVASFLYKINTCLPQQASNPERSEFLNTHTMAHTQKVLLNTDWLAESVVLSGEERKPPKGYRWIEYDGTNVWKRRRCLFTDDGDKILTLLDKPKSEGFLSQDMGLLEIANEWLYHGIGVRRIEKLLNYCVEYKCTGLSRVDLAMDFEPNQAQQDIIMGLSQGKIYVSGKRSGSGFWSTNNDDWMPQCWKGKPIPHCQSWGHKTTSVKWKLYYKSKELRDAGGGWFDKPYIVDQWREAGFDRDNVWRLEVSIHNANQLLFGGEPITRDVWYRHTVALAQSLYTQRFVVRENNGHMDKTNNKVVMFLPVRDLTPIRCKVPEGDRQRNGRISLLRALVNSLDSESVAYDEKTVNGIVNHVDQMVRRDGLQYYFRGMVGVTFEEWAENVTATAKGEVCEQNMKNTDIQPNVAFG